MNDWLYSSPTAFRGKKIFRLGLAGNYGIDESGVRAAIDRGVNFFLWTAKRKGLEKPVHEALKSRRDEIAIAGFVNIGYFGWGVRSGAESLLKSLGTDYLDVLLLGWVGVGSALTSATEKELITLRESGKARSIGVSIHDRPRAGKLAESSPLDLLMIRYNAAHPGAEKDIFPHVQQRKPSILAYTGTSWGRLLKKPKKWEGNTMTAGDCYRFQLSNPNVDVALTGPANRQQLEENLTAFEKGPLSPEEQEWMRGYGRAVHG